MEKSWVWPEREGKPGRGVNPILTHFVFHRTLKNVPSNILNKYKPIILINVRIILVKLLKEALYEIITNWVLNCTFLPIDVVKYW